MKTYVRALQRALAVVLAFLMTMGALSPTVEAASLPLPPGWLSGPVPTSNRVTVHGSDARAFSSGPVFATRLHHPISGPGASVRIPLVSELFVLNPGWEFDYAIGSGGVRRTPGNNFTVPTQTYSLSFNFRRLRANLNVQTAVGDDVVHTHPFTNVQVGDIFNISPNRGGFDTDNYDYTFGGWEIVSGYGAFDNSGSQETRFTLGVNNPAFSTAIIRANFTRVPISGPVTHTVQFTSGADGGVTATLDGGGITSPAQVPAGSTVMFTAEPNPGFRVANWSITGGSLTGADTDTVRSVEYIQDVIAVTVIFEQIPPPTHTVQFSSNAGGTITATVDIDEIFSPAEVLAGETVVFTAEPDTGFRIAGWSITGGILTGEDTDERRRVLNIQGPIAVTVEFEPIDTPPTHTVQFSSGAGGTITATLDGDDAASPFEAPVGSTVEFIAAPDSGYRIASWSITGGSLTGTDADTARSVANIQEPIAVTVTFEQIPPPTHNVQFTSGAGGSITATVESAVITNPAQVQAGRTVVFTAAPSPGFQVAAWNVTGGTLTGANTDTVRSVANIQGPITVTVTFESAAAPAGWVRTGPVPPTNRVIARGTPDSAFSSGPTFANQWFHPTTGNTNNQPFRVPLVSEFFVLNPGWALDYVIDHAGIRRQPGGSTLLLPSGGVLVYHFRRITGNLTVQTAVDGDVIRTNGFSNVPVGVARDIAPNASGFDTDCIFTGWQVITGQGAFGNSNSRETEFTISADSVAGSTTTVRANFTRVAIPPPTPETEPPAYTPEPYPEPIITVTIFNEVLSDVTVTVETTPGGAITVALSLEDFDLEGINAHRLVAMCEDGNLLGGRIDGDTGIFMFEAPTAGAFTIAYTANLRRLSLQLESYAIRDLAKYAEAQLMDVQPIVVNDRIMLPIRFVAYALGAEVDWDGDTNGVTLTLGDKSISFTIGEVLPGMDVPAKIAGSRTMVPLRFISEFFGAVVLWDDETRTAEIIFIPQ